MIESREGLIDALTEAAELEHGLMLQYLFAALSLKKFSCEQISSEQQEQVRSWESRILGIARQEMAHLGTVCNLLSAIGAAPRFGRPNFPQESKSYYGPFDFELTRFSDESVYRFIRAELPQGETPPPPPGHFLPSVHPQKEFLASLAKPAPEPLEYDYVGQLYREIRDGFANVTENELFIGPKFAQDNDTWSRRMNLLLVVDRSTADKAIDFIVLEGEGAPGNRDGSHYGTFLRIREELNAAQQLDHTFDPARPVVPNPQTRPHRDVHGKATLLTNANTIKIAELFNAFYETTILMLMQFYSYGGESAAQRSALRGAIRETMSMALRPLAEILTTMPATEQSSVPVAGPCFEFYSDVRLSTQLKNRWLILLERLKDASEFCKQLSSSDEVNVPEPSRIAMIAQNTGWIRENLLTVLKQEFVL
jgi:ferritin-like protein